METGWRCNRLENTRPTRPRTDFSWVSFPRIGQSRTLRTCNSIPHMQCQRLLVLPLCVSGCQIPVRPVRALQQTHLPPLQRPRSVLTLSRLKCLSLTTNATASHPQPRRAPDSTSTSPTLPARGFAGTGTCSRSHPPPIPNPMPPKNKHSTKRKNAPGKTIVEIAARAIAGDSRRDLLKLYPNASERLIAAIVRARIGAEEWQELLGAELRGLTAEVALQLKDDLRNRRISPNTKGVLLGILHDKMLAAEGRSVLRSANVNFQINNFGGIENTRPQLLAQLKIQRGEGEAKLPPLFQEKLVTE